MREKIEAGPEVLYVASSEAADPVAMSLEERVRWKICERAWGWYAYAGCVSMNLAVRVVNYLLVRRQRHE